MPTSPDSVSAAAAAIQETLAGIGLDDSSQGLAADTIRAALAQHSDTLSAIADAARAVEHAVDERAALTATRDAQMPSEADIRAAQEAVITAAASGDPDAVQRATDHLADLLAEKEAAQDRFNRGEVRSADQLNTATQDLPDASSGSALSNARGPLQALLSAASQIRPPASPLSGFPMAGADPGYGAPAGVAEGDHTVDPAALLDSLVPGDDDASSQSDGLSDPSWAPGAGQTHVSAGELPPQIPTLSGVQTSADVSGRPASPFAPTAGPPAGPSGAGPGAGMGMGPMMPPMGHPMGANGPASGKGNGRATIINRDPDFTGADIDAEIATSGVVGRGEKRR